jgi:hypothetical protein
VARFNLFVVFAEMRTGSNALEEAINQIPRLCCHGEAFNPVFVGHQGQDSLLGIHLAAREADPLALLAAMRAQTDGAVGFRFFHDHDPRVLEAVLSDPSCAKVILTRDPLETYVSLKIARATGQWKLTDLADRKVAKVRFDAAEFAELRERHAVFRHRVRHALKVSGQAPFEIEYAEIGDVDVINGLAAFLGVEGRVERLARRLKRQNPEPIRERVENPEEMEAALGGWTGSEGPVPEPARGARVPTYVAAARAPLLHIPLRGGPDDRVARWLAAVDGVEPGDLRRGFSQKTLRQWKNGNKGSRSFAVVAHPVARAHRAFCRHILFTGAECFAAIREALRTRHGVALPGGDPGPDWDAAAHRAAFLGFLRFARASLAGQTAQRSDPSWSSQGALLTGAAEVILPDMVLREAQLAEGLSRLAADVGLGEVPPPGPPEPDGTGPVSLREVYDAEVERAVRELHNRDYVAFGFRDWEPGD